MGTSIILVGNSATLRGSEMGRKIDKFPDIIRFNGYVLAGHEKDVGCRTTIWARSDARVVSERNLSLFSKVLLCVPPHKFNSPSEKRRIMGMIHRPIVHLVPQEIVAEKMAFYKIPDGKWLSTGLIALLWAVNTYQDITITGFDFFENGKIGLPRHYYGKGNSLGCVPKFHHPDTEKKIVEDLLKKDRVRWLE